MELQRTEVSSYIMQQYRRFINSTKNEPFKFIKTVLTGNSHFSSGSQALINSYFAQKRFWAERRK